MCYCTSNQKIAYEVTEDSKETLLVKIINSASFCTLCFYIVMNTRMQCTYKHIKLQVKNIICMGKTSMEKATCLIQVAIGAAALQGRFSCFS
jgi:hypothetical protein